MAVGMPLVPEGDRAERLDAGTADKRLQSALVRDAGPWRVLGRRSVGAVLPQQGVPTQITAGFLALIRLAQNVRACGWVHLHSSSSIPWSVSNAFQPRHELRKVRPLTQGVE